MANPTTAAGKQRDAATCGVPLRPLSDFLAPRWWPAWLALAIVRGLAALPWPWQSRLARGLGTLGWYLARRERRTTLINLRLARPALSERERRRLGRLHFHSLAYSLFEIGLVWFDRRGRLAQLVRLEGVEHLERALAGGRGALLLGAHFTTNEIAAAALQLTGRRVSAMYKAAGNALLAQVALRSRTRLGGKLIPSDRFVELIRDLQRGGIAIYSPDQRYDGDGRVVVPLFGVPALSNPAAAGIARATKCTVLPYFPERRADGSGYRMHIGAPLEFAPGADPAANVARFHALIEAAVAAAPEQYLWSYKRFRPLPGEPDPYRGGRARGPP